MDWPPVRSLYAAERGDLRESTGFFASDDFLFVNLDPCVSREFAAVVRNPGWTRFVCRAL